MSANDRYEPQPGPRYCTCVEPNIPSPDDIGECPACRRLVLEASTA